MTWQLIDTAPKDGSHILACRIPSGQIRRLFGLRPILVQIPRNSRPPCSENEGVEC